MSDVAQQAAAATNGLGDIKERGDAESAARPPRKAPKPIITRDSAGLEKALADIGWHWRYNTRAHKFEVSFQSTNNWQDMTDRLEGEMREQIASRFTFAASAGASKQGKGAPPAWFGRDSWTDAINALAYRSEIDPFQEWLELLPPWDLKPRISDMLRTLWNVEEPQRGTEEHSLISWASRSLVLGAVARTYQPGYPLHNMVVLIGPQGCGKSTLVKWLLPAFLRDDLFDDGFHFGAARQEQAEALQGLVYMEAGEMAGANRADLEAMKAFITRTDDRTRLSYRRNPESMPRRCVIVGTTNDPRPLPNDPSGNRRFVPVVLEPRADMDVGAIRTWLDERRVMMWAEAKELWRDQFITGITPWMPDAFAAAQRGIAERHRRKDEMLEVALDNWLATAPPQFELSSAAVGVGMAESGASVKLSQRDSQRLGAALRNAGYERTRQRGEGGRVYLWEMV